MSIDMHAALSELTGAVVAAEPGRKGKKVLTRQGKVTPHPCNFVTSLQRTAGSEVQEAQYMPPLTPTLRAEPYAVVLTLATMVSPNKLCTVAYI